MLENGTHDRGVVDRPQNKAKIGWAEADKQIERFKETARMLGIDEDSKAFERAFAKLSRENRAVDIEDIRPARSMK